MISEHYSYPAEKLTAARRMLMAPHPKGEADAFAHAFHECDLGLRHVRPDDLDDTARSWVQTIRQTMDTTGISDPQGRGTWFLKAERLSVEEKYRFSSAVDELAHWFHERFMGRQ
jgi:hypothetical protein